ncbi:hypothetical protein [Lactiplantibacillus pentosus]|jgi:uncharacterized membrane protein|uniref:hypothetical protein n=1 Tax=Lactiplantibacillus pentosus TaxID=1589 RepID=UPI00207A7D56|nr:hypothetical protein [Lactiplantibacillus pentosus]USJ85549.1 hypothetical protein KSF55_12455 [Lactiplantibacillus pentosus]
MFLIVYCTFAIAVFFWIFGFVKTAIIIGVLALGLIAYSFIRREINRRRLLKRRTITNKSR